jgi:sec-independent protein translocase protein TatB
VFNLQGSEIIVILLIALVVLGPDRLPDAVRRFMQTYNELKKMGSGFQAEIKSAFDEPMREMRDTAQTIRDAADPTKLMAEAEAENRVKADANAAVAAEPVAAEPVASEPVASEPVAAEPVAAEPVAAEPVVEPVVETPGGTPSSSSSSAPPPLPPRPPTRQTSASSSNGSNGSNGPNGSVQGGPVAEHSGPAAS